jgi:ATP-binding cassette subfamily C protein
MKVRLPVILLARREAASATVLICLLLAGLAEAASLGALLPALSAIASGGGEGNSVFVAAVGGALSLFGAGPALGNIILLAVAFMAVKALLSFAALAYAGVLAARVSIALRRRLIAAFFGARWSFLAEQKGGHLANALGNDAARAGDAYLVSAQVAAYAIQAAAYIGLNLLINWRVALFGLAGGVIIILFLGRLVEMGRRAGYRQTDATAELATLTADAMAGLKPIKSMWRHHAIQARIAWALNGVYRSLVSREIARAGLIQGSDLLMAVLIGSGLYLGHAVAGLPLPELIVSGIGFFQILSITSRLQRYLQQAVQLESAFLRTTALIGRAEAQREINQGHAPPPVPCAIRFESVTFDRGEARILDGLDLEIAPGDITVLQGHSGAGKTTIIDLLLGLIEPSDGRILLGEMPLAGVDLWAWRRRIGYVPQELNLFHASIRDNVTLLDPHIGDAEVWEALELAGAGPFVRQLPNGLDTIAGEMGSKLSGGERQRISLARALVTTPSILILDEVTSALDPVTEAQVLANITGLRGRFTVLTISHRPAWSMVADRVYDIRGGKAERRAGGFPSAFHTDIQQGGLHAALHD